MTLLAIGVLGVLMTILISIGAIASKTALDPSFSPLERSDSSASLEVSDPRLGRALVKHEGESGRGYMIRANLEAHGLKGDTLFTRWTIRRVGASSTSSADTSVNKGLSLEKVVPGSVDDQLSLQRWIPAPRHGGQYVAEVELRSLGGGALANAHSAPFSVLGSDCCRQYSTPSYTAILPKRWALEEDYEPNPESRFVTVARGPHESALVIDTSAIDKYKHHDALDNAKELATLLSENSPDYHRLDWRLRFEKGERLVEWSYEVDGGISTDILFYRGDWGFAVLGRSDDGADFRETRDLARAVAHSIDPQN